MRMAKGRSFMQIEADYAPDGWEDRSSPPPVFSEAFLYPAIGKGDARFVLGVAEEYAHIQEALGPAATRAILQVKPRLCERLGLGKTVKDFLEDARDEQDVWREKQYPLEVTIEEEAAHGVWLILHHEYERFFDPEKSMPAEQLALYRELTERLGPHEQEMMEKADAKRPEMIERNEKARARQKQEKDARLGRARALRDALRETELPPDVAALVGEVWPEEAATR